MQETAVSVTEDKVRLYTVECAWPLQPDIWRKTVVRCKEPVARASVLALQRMGHPVRVHVTFSVRADDARTEKGPYLVGEWTGRGDFRVHYRGHLSSSLPKWVLGRAPVDRYRARKKAR